MLFFRILYRVSLTVLSPDPVTRTLLYQRKAARRGEKFLVSWSRSTSTSSIYRYQAVNLIFGQFSIAHCLYLNTFLFVKLFLFVFFCFDSAYICFALDYKTIIDIRKQHIISNFGLSSIFCFLLD